MVRGAVSGEMSELYETDEFLWTRGPCSAERNSYISCMCIRLDICKGILTMISSEVVTGIG